MIFSKEIQKYLLQHDVITLGHLQRIHKQKMTPIVYKDQYDTNKFLMLDQIHLKEVDITDEEGDTITVIALCLDI